MVMLGRLLVLLLVLLQLLLNFVDTADARMACALLAALLSTWR